MKVHVPKGYIFFFIFLINLLSLHCIQAVDYIVGDDSGWTELSVNYQKWSAQHSFTVGDALVFNYAVGKHDAYEVTQEAYRNCDSSNGVIEPYDSGNDRVLLTEAKKYWFICTFKGHCLGGMRLAIQVNEGNVTTGVDGSMGPTSNAPINGIGRSRWVWTSYLVALVGFVLTNS